MKVSVRELKDRLSEHLRAVQGGQSIVVTSHDKPVARLSPVPRESASGIERMLDEGIAAQILSRVFAVLRLPHAMRLECIHA